MYKSVIILMLVCLTSWGLTAAVPDTVPRLDAHKAPLVEPTVGNVIASENIVTVLFEGGSIKPTTVPLVGMLPVEEVEKEVHTLNDEGGFLSWLKIQKTKFDQNFERIWSSMKERSSGLMEVKTGGNSGSKTTPQEKKE